MKNGEKAIRKLVGGTASSSSYCVIRKTKRNPLSLEKKHVKMSICQTNSLANVE